MTEITFELENEQRVIIKRDGEVVGHIFSPASSGEDTLNAIQVCGFSEAYDLWGCGVFEGTKDIQLLYDEGFRKPGKEALHKIDNKCIRCYEKECQCDNDDDGSNPFNVKREKDLRHRLKIKGDTR